MNIKYLRILTLLPILFLASINSIYAFKFIDIDEYNFVESARFGVRVVVFDTDKQEYDSISYYHLGKDDREDATQIIHEHSDFDINANGDICLKKKPKEQTIFRSFGVITKTDGLVLKDWEESQWHFYDARDKKSYKKIIFSQEVELIPAKLIIEKYLKYKTHERYGEHFSATFYKRKDKKSSFVEENEEGEFAHLSNFKHSRGGELGYLGELSVEMTMISFGYFIKLTSQNESNQGIDGVYLGANDDSEMILTESKAQSTHIKQNSAEVIYRKGLHEVTLTERITEMLNGEGRYTNPIFQETARKVKEKIEETPENVFKLASRLKVDGRCSYYGGQFDIKAHMDAGNNSLCQSSPTKQKVEATKKLFSTICSSPEERVQLFMAANPMVTPDLLSVILENMSIEASKKDEALKILGLEKSKRQVSTKKKLEFSQSDDQKTDEAYSKDKGCVKTTPTVGKVLDSSEEEEPRSDTEDDEPPSPPSSSRPLKPIILKKQTHPMGKVKLEVTKETVPPTSGKTKVIKKKSTGKAVKANP